MFLTSCVSLWRHPHRGFRLLIVILVPILLHPAICEAQEPPAPCIVDVPVYGPSGDLLLFRVTRVTAKEDPATNVLSLKGAGVKTTRDGRGVIFSSDRIVSREIEITLKDPKGVTVITHFVVTSCRLRRSIFHGQLETGADVSGTGVTGRLSGCKFDGDWWVRAIPMFGGNDGIGGSNAVDGYVNSDGSFWLFLGDYGVRHAMIIGRGKSPLKVIAFDLTTGKHTDLGSVDLKGLCP